MCVYILYSVYICIIYITYILCVYIHFLFKIFQSEYLLQLKVIGSYNILTKESVPEYNMMYNQVMECLELIVYHLHLCWF